MTTDRQSLHRCRLRASSRFVLAATAVVLAGVTLAAAGPALAAGPSADLGVRVLAPRDPAAGSTFELTVIAADNGPSAATDIVVGVDVGTGLVVTAAPGGAIATGGHSAGYSVPRLRVGSRVVLTLTVQVPAGATGRKVVVAAARSLSVPDDNAANDRKQIVLRPVPAA